MRLSTLFLTLGYRRLSCAVFAALVFLSCRDAGRNTGDSARGSLPPVFSTTGNNTNWDTDAGPVMLVSVGNSADSAGVVLPELTDSTIGMVQGARAPVAGFAFDLFGRGGKVESSKAVTVPDSGIAKQDCDAWPAVGIHATPGWRVGFAKGHVQAIKLDSIEAMPSRDSAALAASLAQTAATLPTASDPTFRGLPFRVRSAYTFRLDSIDVVVADVVRSVNEEANPRLEHLLVIGERPAGTTGRYTVGYYGRTSGAEETTQATEVLAAVHIGSTKKPAIAVNVENDEGRNLGLIERVAPGQWRFVWRSAFTDC